MSGNWYHSDNSFLLSHVLDNCKIWFILWILTNKFRGVQLSFFLLVGNQHKKAVNLFFVFSLDSFHLKTKFFPCQVVREAGFCLEKVMEKSYNELRELHCNGAIRISSECKKFNKLSDCRKGLPVLWHVKHESVSKAMLTLIL